ncbi:hypothetical protein ACOMHN_050169 [Nucella lapillus]
MRWLAAAKHRGMNGALYVAPRPRPELTFIWVGADDSRVPGQYLWNDGTPLPNTSSLWASDQPRRIHPGRHCARYFGPRLGVDCCNISKPVVCQKGPDATG